MPSTVSIPDGLPRLFSPGSGLLHPQHLLVSIPDGLPRLFSRWNAPEATREEYLFQSQTGFPGYLAGQNCGASHRVSQFQSQTGFPGYLADKRAKQNVIE